MALAAWLSLTNPPSQCLKTCTIDAAGIQLITEFEGYMPFIYRDVAGLRTVGIGHLVLPGERFPQPLLPEDAATLLRRDLRASERGLNRCASVPFYPNQASATISLIYNIGEGNFCGSTLLKRINAKRHAEVPAQFLLWSRARVNGKLVPVKGLTRRREAEADLYKRKP